MKPLASLLLPAALLAAPAAALADRDDHRHGWYRGHHHHHASAKQQYWDGACMVERKWKKNGDYKEERRCRPQPAYIVQQPTVVYAPAPAPVVVVPSPGIVIHGSIRLP
jgi:hypothetical protein